MRGISFFLVFYIAFLLLAIPRLLLKGVFAIPRLLYLQCVTAIREVKRR